MSYTKTEWKTGDIITAEKMNKLEEGISQLWATVNDKVTNPTTGAVEQILAVATVDGNGKPTSYKAVDKPISSGGTPTPVSLVSEMTDTTKTYLYTGTEEGYTSGNWYYYNGSAWVSGGKYGSASGVGWTPSQITLLETIGEYLVFKDATTGQAMFDSLITSLRSGSSGSDEPDTPVNPDEPDVPDTPTSYTITNSLVNVTTDNEVTSVEANGSYTANLTAESGYYIDSVTVTMGGVNVTDTVYTDGVITIAEVTGNVVIVANGAESDNLIVLSECGAGSLPDGAIADGTTMLATTFIEVEPTSYYYNFIKTLPSGNKMYTQKIYCYDENQTYISGAIFSTGDGTNGIGVVDLSLDRYSGVKYVRCIFSAEWTNPYLGLSGKVV